MISLNGSQVALISAAVARVAGWTAHKCPNADEHIEAIGKAAGAEFVSVYDHGPRDDKRRYIRFDFANDSIEVEVGPQPEFVNQDNRPEGDDLPPGTPVSLAA